MIAIENLAKIHDAVGDRVTAVFVTGTDFGTQDGPFISPNAYRKLYQPFHRRINDWIHENTSWKTFIHSCGSIVVLLPDILDAGFDGGYLWDAESMIGYDWEAMRRFGDRAMLDRIIRGEWPASTERDTLAIHDLVLDRYNPWNAY